MAWAIKWRSENKLNGKREYFMGRLGYHGPDVPELVAGCTFLLFRTRSEARKFIKKTYGYMRNRPELRAEPHGWKMPKAVKVTVALQEPSITSIRGA